MELLLVGWLKRDQTELKPTPTWPQSYLSDDIGEGFMQFLVEMGQLLEVTVVFMDGDHDLVHLIHCLKQPRLHKSLETKVQVCRCMSKKSTDVSASLNNVQG